MNTSRTFRALSITTTMILASLSLAACDTSGEPTDEPEGRTPFAISARVEGASVEEVTEALATFVHEHDDTTGGLPADWIIAGGSDLEEGETAVDAALRLPGGSRIVEVCNHHYASMAMSFGGHHGVALPCEIAIVQNGDAVDVVLLEPEAIFGVFFGDIPADQAAGMAGLAASVRAELSDLIDAALAGHRADFLDEPVGPLWDDQMMADFAEQSYSVELDVEIPEGHRGSEESRKAFKDAFVAGLMTVLTHEGMEQVGSTVPGLSVEDWRSARRAPLSLPGQVSVVEMCSPTYATAALSTGTHHAPALPCQVAIWIEGDMLRVHLLDPNFIFPVFFADAPQEMMASMGDMAAAVGQDLRLIVEAAAERVAE